MWQFAEAMRGLADGCLALGVPVTGGNVSFYNQTGDVAILPTPVVGVLGVIDDVAPPHAMGFAGAGRRRAAARRDPRRVRRLGVGLRGARPPRAAARRRSTCEAERALAEVLVAGPASGCSRAAHDLSDGGLAQTLVEMAAAARHRRGRRLPGGADPFVALFSESTARAVVAVRAGAPRRAVLVICARGRVQVHPLRHDAAVPTWCFEGLFAVPVEELPRDVAGHLPRPVRADAGGLGAASRWPVRRRRWTPGGAAVAAAGGSWPPGATPRRRARRAPPGPG